MIVLELLGLLLLKGNKQLMSYLVGNAQCNFIKNKSSWAVGLKLMASRGEADSYHPKAI